MRVVLAVTREGLARAWSARALVLMVWLIHLALATAAAFPFWRALRSVLGSLPEADVLGTGVHLGALADLAELRPGLLSGFGLTLVAVAALGLLVGAAVSGGVIEALRSTDDCPLGHRFGRGAGRFFGRFVGVGLLVGLLAGVAGAVALFPFMALARSYFRSGWEPGRLAPIGGAVVGGFVLLLALLVLDAARIHVVRSDAGVFSGLRAGLGLVLRHPVVWLGTWLMNAALAALSFGLYVSFREVVPSGTGPLILAMVLAQQAFAITRTGFRVALLASESALVDTLHAVPTEPTPVAVPVAAQSDSLSAV